MFPVNSTSLETKRIARVIAVFQRRPFKSKLVKSAGVYNCRKTTGTTLWSAHAVGDAVDLMMPGSKASDRLAVAEAVVADGTGRTIANAGVQTHVYFVITNDRQWVRGQGWSHYSGVYHSDHVHVGCSGSFSSSSFDCGDRLPGVPYVGR